MTTGARGGDALATVRRLLLALVTFGTVATTVDLLLIAHYEDIRQLIPLTLNGLALLAVAWYLAGGGARSMRALQSVMAAFVLAGLVGVVLHYQGNLEFQLEIDPSQSAWTLFGKVMRAKAPPALAPGVMAQLGLLGLIFSYRHPALDRRMSTSTVDTGD
jgi:hypothetical protein